MAASFEPPKLTGISVLSPLKKNQQIAQAFGATLVLTTVAL